MRQYKFMALVTLDPGRQEPPASTRTSPTRSWSGAAVFAGPLRRYFPALIWRADGQPLRPGDTNVIVTIGITDDQACEYFDSGQQVTLWNGHICGDGTIARQVFFTWAI